MALQKFKQCDISCDLIENVYIEKTNDLIEIWDVESDLIQKIAIEKMKDIIEIVIM